MIDLLSTTARVETPFIIATLGDVSFGIYSKETREILNSSSGYTELISTYPNFVQSLQVDKINGTINTYTLNLIYAIRPGDDPNLIDKVLSKISKDRTIKLSYGDLSLPTFIYKEEEAIVSKVRTQVNMASSTISYTLTCTSKALSTAAGTYTFPKRQAKPSDVIKELLYDNNYGLLEVFYGMIDKELVASKGLIAGDDKVTTIEAKKSISLFDYLNYLVSCMVYIGDEPSGVIKSSRYTITVIDDTTGVFNGPYFKIVRVTNSVSEYNLADMYEIDIGYPSKDIVLSFSIDDDETYSILLDYSEKIKQPNFIYRINNQGEIESEYSPALSNSSALMKTTTADKTWWTQLTQYPITATLTLKGLLRPAVLMNKIKIKVLFYGKKHYASGIYIITKQTDNISSDGYRTTLKLLKIQGDNYDN